MKHQRAALLLLIVLLLPPMAGCESYRNGWEPYRMRVSGSDPAVGSDPTVRQAGSDPVTLLIWGETDADSLEAFRREHPEVVIEYEQQDAINWETEWIAALAADAGPDVFVYESERAGWASSLDVLEDLSDEAYSLDSLRTLMTDAEWAETWSLDRKRQPFLPIYAYPAMLFYREDIMRQNGFPSEPDALAAYLADPVQWMGMVRELKSAGHLAMEWRESPWNVGALVAVPFTQTLEWHMKQNQFTQVLQQSALANREGLVANINIWDEAGKVALRNDELVMFSMGAWGVDLLQEWLPEQTGKWRATRLPAGLSAQWGTRWMSMNQASDQKDLAWELMESTVFAVRTYYAGLEAQAYPYFGNQQVFALVRQMREEMVPMLRTPLDAQVADLFWSQQYLLYTGNMPAADFIDYVNREIEARFGLELSALRDMMSQTEP